MEQCYKCGINEQLANLSNAITSEGIVKICDLCAEREGHPIIAQTRLAKEKETQEQQIKERMSKTSYLNPLTGNTEEVEKQDAHLKEIIKINFEQKGTDAPKKRDDLIDNFHWIVMRARRLKHISQEKLAKELKVPEPIIKAAEKGIIDEVGYDLVHKLETYLSIRIIRPEVRQKIEEMQTKQVGFDPITTKELTINDLIDLKTKKEDDILGNPREEKEPAEENTEESHLPTEKELDKIEEEIAIPKKDPIIMGEPTKKSNLSQEELNDIIFGK